MPQTITRDDLCWHQIVDTVQPSPCTAALQYQLARLALRTVGVRRMRALSQSVVAVKANDVAASLTRPVNVEQRSAAAVAHLADILDRSLPHQVFYTGQRSYIYKRRRNTPVQTADVTNKCLSVLTVKR